MFMKLTAAPRTRALVSLTPLIDVVFILLIFFMLASNFIEWRYIKLSTNEDTVIRVNTDKISKIEIRRRNVYLLNKQKMQLSTIVSLIRVRCRLDIDHPVVIKLESGVPVQTLVTVLEKISEFAANNVSLSNMDVQ